jgi:hypothetical protein
MAPPNTTFVSRYSVNSSIIGANTNGNTTPAAARFPDVAHRISQPSSTTTTAKKARVANKSISFLAPHKLQQEFKCNNVKQNNVALTRREVGTYSPT